jgi:formate hydrogenlyase transcriptional activator
MLIADNDRRYWDASFGAGKLLRLSREKIIGRILDEFATPVFKPRVSELWQASLQERGTLESLIWMAARETSRYTAKGNVLPVRTNLLILRDKTVQTETEGQSNG